MGELIKGQLRKKATILCEKCYGDYESIDSFSKYQGNKINRNIDSFLDGFMGKK